MNDNDNADLNAAAEIIAAEAEKHFEQFFFWGWIESDDGKGRWVLKLSDQFDEERLRELAKYIGTVLDR